MASPGFPQRKSQGAGGTSGGMTSQLDGPPPSPAGPPPGGLTPGAAPAPMPTFEQMAQPLTAGTPGRAVPQEIAVGMMQTATTVYGILDSFASIAPDLAADFALQKDLLQRTMAKLMVNTGQPAAPSSTGLNFPGGGFLSGTM